MSEYTDKSRNFDILVGQTITEILQTHDTMTFKVSDGTQYQLYHEQDCCESVWIDDIIGDLNDLVGEQITLAEEVEEEGEPTEYEDHTTWTFYKLATQKGYVTIRWCGTSNGYYSESVNFVELEYETPDENLRKQIAEAYATKKESYGN